APSPSCRRARFHASGYWSKPQVDHAPASGPASLPGSTPDEKVRMGTIEIKWTDTDPVTGARRFLCAEKFAGERRFRVKLRRRGPGTRGRQPPRGMWEHVLDSLRRRYRRREGVDDADVEQVERILADWPEPNSEED